MSTRTVRAALAACALTAAGVVAGCGSDDTSSSSSSAAKAPAVEANTQIKVKPKTIGVLDLIRQSPIDNNSDLTVEEAAKALGWKVEFVDGAGDPQKVLRGAQTLINKGVDGLITVSVDSPLIRQPLADARSKKIPTCATGGDQAPSDQYDAQYTEFAPTQGRIVAQDILKDNPKAKVIILRSTTIYTGRKRHEEFVKTLKAAPGAQIVFDREIDLADSVNSTTKAVQDALTAHPDATAVWAEYDTMTQAAVTAVRQSGKKAKIWSYFLTPANLTNLKTDSPLEGVSEMPFNRGPALCLDQFLKMFQSGATSMDRNAMKASNPPYMIVNRDNLDSVLKQAGPSKGSVDAANPPERTLKPFYAQWAKDYPAK